MIVKLKRLLDGKTFQLTDLANDLFLKNDQRNGVDVENPIELLNGIFIQGNKLIIPDNYASEIGNDGLT